jgi:hypothetical protein
LGGPTTTSSRSNLVWPVALPSRPLPAAGERASGEGGVPARTSFGMVAVRRILRLKQQDDASLSPFSRASGENWWRRVSVRRPCVKPKPAARFFRTDPKMVLSPRVERRRERE